MTQDKTYWVIKIETLHDVCGICSKYGYWTDDGIDEDINLAKPYTLPIHAIEKIKRLRRTKKYDYITPIKITRTTKEI